MSKQIPTSSLFVSIVAAIGGLLFGYNTSVISGVLLFITRTFDLTTLEQELIVSTLIIGALLGALFGGVIADAIGRKRTLFATLVLFFIGVVTLGAAEGFTSLLVGRFISGIAVGIVSMAVPLYIAEMSPAGCRGALVSINQLCITIGILLAYVVAYAYAEAAEWRSMFTFSLIPIVAQFILLFFIPETPYWLVSQGKTEKGEAIAHRMHLPVSIEKTEKKTHWSALFAKNVRTPFLIGIGIAVFQSITGINTVIYYAPQIFQLAGYSAAKVALLATVLVGAINVIMTIVSLWLIDWLGRRFLLILGLIGMGASLLVLGLSFGHGSPLAGLISLLCYVSFFAISLGPVAWLIISEVYPLGIRGRAMGVAAFANWVSNYFVSLTFLSLIDILGSSGTFWLYAFICLLGLWFVIKLVPETKGKTFEEIQHFWKKG